MEEQQKQGWGSWGFSALSDLQKAAEEISKNALEAAKGAAKGVTHLQSTLVETLEPEGGNDRDSDAGDEPFSEKLRRDALHRLEAASPDSSIGHGLKALDSSMESLASEAYQALGNAWKGGMSLIHRLESSAEQLAGSVHSEGLAAAAGALAPKLIQSGKELTAKGIKALEYVGKETLDVLVLGDVDNGAEHGQTPAEEASFDHCFYIYGGPEQLEELEALSTHYALVCARAKSKMTREERALFDELCNQVPRILALGDGADDSPGSSGKGKQIEEGQLVGGSEMKVLRDASVNKAAEMAMSFTATLRGLTISEVVQKTSSRVEAIKAEGVHRLSEVCAVCMSHLVLLGRSFLKDMPEESVAPEDCLSKAVLARSCALDMASDLEAVSNSFITGIGDVVAAFQAAKEDGQAPAPVGYESIEDKARVLCNDLKGGGTAAIKKVQNGLEQLEHVLLSTYVSGTT